MKTKSITTRIANARKASQASAHRAALREQVLAHPEVTDALRAFPRNLRSSVNLYGGEYSDDVSVYLTLSNLNSLKSDRRLLAALAPFTGDEWTPTTQDYTSHEPNRDFTFTRKVAIHIKPNAHTRWLNAHGFEYYIPTTFTLSVRIAAYAKTDSPTCRIVVKEIREKVVQEEIKEIVCA